jgi:hypothetical protein
MTKRVRELEEKLAEEEAVASGTKQSKSEK